MNLRIRAADLDMQDEERKNAMSRDFEELDYRETPLGELILRRRRAPVVRRNGNLRSQTG